MQELRFRQVHLDFHTSEAIDGIGAEFDKAGFQEALQDGFVDSITVFSKCHHGWAYHPTAAGEMHPGLEFDLLAAQVEAANEIGVDAPVYLSAGLDEKEAVRHPEWLARLADESLTWVPDFVGAPGFHLLCFNTGYLPLLLRQVDEVMQRYHPVEVFLDIAAVHPCYCAACRADIAARGEDIRDEAAVMHQAERVYKNYCERVRETMRRHSKSCRIFHNAGHITRGRRDLARANTHLELESLPTGGWGYNHFPMSAAYVQGLGMEYLGMTGKFHTTWGEFGGFKHPNALRYETALNLAFGAKCSIGDQLHPRGEMNRDTYRLIGTAYREVKAKEPWCSRAENRFDIGILGEEAVSGATSDRDAARHADTGANRVMLEGGYLYRFVDLEEDFSRFKLLVLPDSIRLDAQLAQRLQAYLAAGGKILATGQSGLAAGRDSFALDFGAGYKGRTACKPDYLLPGFPLTTGQSAQVMYGAGHEIALRGGEAFASRKDSYFNRDITHFCSHQHAPDAPGTERPAACFGQGTAYIGWEVFSDYSEVGSLHCRELITHAIDHLLGEDKTLTATLPDRGIATLTHQQAENRDIVHLLFAHTTLRGDFTYLGQKKRVEVVEDIVPLHDVEVTVKAAVAPARVYLAPQGQDVPFAYEHGRVRFTVPEMECHCMVALEYERER